MQRSIVKFCAACSSTVIGDTAAKPTPRGRDELFRMRATVAPMEATKLEAMTSFKDNRAKPLNESDASMRRRLIYQSRYRGMVEMDIIFGSFAQAKLASLPADMLPEYDTILRQFDNDLFNWLVSGAAPPAEVSSLRIWKEVTEFVKNNTSELLGHKL